MVRKQSMLVLVFMVVLGSPGLISGAVMASGPTGAEIITMVDSAMQSPAKIMEEQMTIINAGGQQRTRKIQAFNKSTAETDQMLVRFLDPADVAGTGFLMSGDDMWLYLPALGKVRRIAGHARKGSFMGSDLSYEDMESLGSRGFAVDYDADFLRLAQMDGEDVYLLELNARTFESPYGKLEMWVSQSTSLPRSIRYYDKDGKLLKELKTYDITEVGGRWVAGTMEMANIQTGTKTILEVIDVQFDADIDDGMFTIRSLERGR